MIHRLKDLSIDSPALSQPLAEFIDLCLELKGDDSSAKPQQTASGSPREDSFRSSAGRTKSVSRLERRGSVVGSLFTALRSATSKGDSSNPRTVTNSSNEMEREVSEDLEEKDPEDLDLLKIVTFRRWIDDVVFDMLQRGNAHTIKYLTIESVHPLMQVFSDKFRGISLRNRLLRPMLQSVKKDRETDGSNSRLSGMFSGRHSVESNNKSPDSSGLLISNVITVSNIRVRNLTTQKSNQSLLLQVGLQSEQSSSHFETKMVFDKTRSQWVCDSCIELTVVARSSNFESVILSLRNKGFVNDSAIGSLQLPFNPYDPPNFTDTAFPLRLDGNHMEGRQKEALEVMVNVTIRSSGDY